MENSKVAIKSLDKLLPVLSLSGIGSFKNSVVFTKLSDGLHLENLREIVGERIRCYIIIQKINFLINLMNCDRSTDQQKFIQDLSFLIWFP